MWAIKHKQTGEVQFVENPETHDMSLWIATELTEEPNEFHKFENGRLVTDEILKAKRIRDSELGGLSPAEIEERTMIKFIEKLERGGIINAAQAKNLKENK